MEDEQISLANCRVRAMVGGHSGPWVLAWPGLGMTAEEFLPLLRQAPNVGMRAVAIDPPGHGQSSAIPKWSREALHDLVVGVLQHFRIDGVVLVGHSIGGLALLSTLPMQEPETKGVVLIDSALRFPYHGMSLAKLTTTARNYLSENSFRTWAEYMANERANSAKWTPDIEEAVRSAAIEISDGVRPGIGEADLIEALRFSSEFDLGTVSHLAIPGLLLIGGRGPVGEDELEKGVDRLKQVLPKLQVELLRQGGHELLRDCPAEVVSSVSGFVTQVGTTSRGG